MESVEVSIIVPVYGVEKYIEKCARSLFEQTFKGCEYIFVNDCTKDRSMEVLGNVISQYPNLQERIVIINHPANKGLPATRNTGLRIAKGKYIINCDSDDYVEPNMVDEFYKKAIEGDYDIVWSDFFATKKNKDILCVQLSKQNNLICIKNMMAGNIHGSVCNKFVRRSLYIDNNIWFPEGENVWEDLCTSIKLFACANSVAYLPKSFYHYVQYNSGAYTKEVSVNRCIQQIDNTKSVVIYLETKNLMRYFYDEINLMKLNSKLLLLYSMKKSNFELWNTIFPESNSYIGKHLIDRRLKLLEYAAKYKLYWILCLNQLLRIMYKKFSCLRINML
jgi:glycosyltransferase involved in cell wall biosynthesis